MTQDTSTTVPFVLRMPSQFLWTVRVPVPVDEGYQIATFQAMFKPVDQPRLDAMRGVGLADGQPLPTEDEICREVLVGWRKLQGPTGEELDFSAEARDQLLRVPVVRAAVVATYMLAMSGAGARKNA